MKLDALRVTYSVGVCLIVLGGLVAAVTGPLTLELGSWLAAYLVLVCGVAQCIFAIGHTALGTAAPPAWEAWVRFATWNLGNLLVIVGALLRLPVIADIGAVPLMVALVLTLRSTLYAQRRLPAVVYRGVLLVLIVSVPIGLALSHIKAART